MIGSSEPGEPVSSNHDNNQPAERDLMDTGLTKGEETDLAVNSNPTPSPIPDTNVEMGRENVQGSVKRFQDSEGKYENDGKWRRREGIKRCLRDIPRKLYEECEDNLDERVEQKRCKMELNCLSGQRKRFW